jgi:hypothetical protein
MCNDILTTEEHPGYNPETILGHILEDCELFVHAHQVCQTWLRGVNARGIKSTQFPVCFP